MAEVPMARVAVELSDSTSPNMAMAAATCAQDPAPLPQHEIAHFPGFADHLANPRLLKSERLTNSSRFIRIFHFFLSNILNSCEIAGLSSVVRGVLDPHVRLYQLEFGKVVVGRASHRRDCHSAAPSSPFSRRFNSDGEGMSAK